MNQFYSNSAELSRNNSTSASWNSFSKFLLECILSIRKFENSENSQHDEHKIMAQKKSMAFINKLIPSVTSYIKTTQTIKISWRLIEN